MKCYESGVSERLYTLTHESDAIARLLAAVAKRRPSARTSQEPARGLFKDQDHGCKLVILYIEWTTHASGCTVIHQSCLVRPGFGRKFIVESRHQASKIGLQVYRLFRSSRSTKQPSKQVSRPPTEVGAGSKRAYPL